MKKIISILLMLIVTLSTVYAADNKDNVEKDLTAQYSHSNCRTQLTLAHINALAKLPGITDLSNEKSKLTPELQQLEGLTSADKKKDFEKAKETLTDDIRAADKAIQDVRKSLKKLTLTKEAKDTVKTDFQNAQTAFSTCNNAAEKLTTQSTITKYQAQITAWNDAISKLKAQGADTSKLEAIVSQAQTQLLPALQKAADATDSKARKDALDTVQNLNPHLWENFDIAKIKIMLAKLSTDTNKDKITEATNTLDDAEQHVTPRKKADKQDINKFREDIKKATEILKDLQKTYTSEHEEKQKIEAAIKYHTAQIQKWNEAITKLKMAGEDTPTLEAVVNEAQTQLLPALQKAADATDPAARKDAFESAKNMQLHLWANFEIARLRLTLKKLPATADQQAIADINKLLDDATQTATAGTTYSKDNSATVQKNLKEAANNIRALMKANRPAQQKKEKKDDEHKASRKDNHADTSNANEVKE